MNERFKKLTMIDLVSINPAWPMVKQGTTGMWPLSDPDWYKRSGVTEKLEPFLEGGGPGGAQAGATPKAEEKTEEVEEVVVEKANLDVELSGYDPAKKIKVIKEVRAIFKLGLKEAKDLVESAPCWIMKQAKRDDAQEIHDKLTEVGATLRLV